MQGSPVYISYPDASKAFDRINHWKLFEKMLKRNFPIVVIRILMYWYCNQQFCVRWGSNMSALFNVSNGVRQGGIMSPILFNLYMNDLSQSLSASKVGCNINGLFINHLLYADDSCLLAPSPSALQKLLRICEEFANSNCVIFNETKTKCMVVKPKGLSRLYVPSVFLNGKALNYVNEQKYLGVFICHDLSDDRDISRHVRGLYCRGNMLINKFKFCSDEVKSCLFKSYCSSVYGGPLWCIFKTASFKKLTVAFNNVYRKLFSIKRGTSMSLVYAQNDVNSFSVLLRKLMYSFKCRLETSDNIYVNHILNSIFYRSHSSLTQRWVSSLYVCGLKGAN